MMNARRRYALRRRKQQQVLISRSRFACQLLAGLFAQESQVVVAEHKLNLSAGAAYLVRLLEALLVLHVHVRAPLLPPPRRLERCASR